MPTFQYKAQDESGKILRGRADAQDKFELARQLEHEGKKVITAKESKKKTGFLQQINNLFVTVRLREKVVFTRNLGAMIDAGLPLARALRVLERQTKNARLKAVIGDIQEDIRQGGALNTALEKHENVFPPLFIAMVKAGEESGGLPSALETIAEHLQRSYELKKRVQGAMIYPAIIIIAMVVIGILMMLFVVPTLTKTFEDLNVDLPPSTQAVLSLSTFMKDHTFIFLSLIVVVIAALWYGLKTSIGKRLFEWVVLRVPVIGELVKKVNAARTARTLSSLLSAGVPMPRAIAITRDVVQNSYYKNVLTEAEEKVQRGIGLSEVFSSHENLYPILVGEMTSVGEETGKISELLLDVASFYEGEVQQSTKDLSTIIEPVLMIIIGAAVGFFAFSMITPMYSVLGGI